MYPSSSSPRFPLSRRSFTAVFLLIFWLLATTGCGSTPSESDDTAINQAPTADAGPDRAALVGETVTFQGGASDVDGDPLTYSWAIVRSPEGSSAALNDTDTLVPWMIPDVAGIYEVGLTVSDGQLSSEQDTVTLTATRDNETPVADAGPDLTATTGETVTLQGSGYDPDGDPLSYAWSIVGAPAGSVAALDAADTASPTITPDVSGDYVIGLTVDDGSNTSAMDIMTLTANDSAPANSAPVADAGADQSVSTGDTVTLDGSGSYDPDGDSLTWEWTLDSQPAGSSATLSAADTVSPTFVADVAGDYVATLVVHDGALSSTADTVVVTATDPVGGNTAPVADAGPDQSVITGDTVYLDGTGSYDPDGDTLSWQWSLVQAPPGSQATLDQATSASPSFVADLDGSYTVRLVVDDGQTQSLHDDVSITATTPPPPPQGGRVITTVTLDPATTGTVPITFGQVFAPGDVLADEILTLQTVGGDTAYSTQADIRAYHDDGSIRHAVLTALVPVTAGQNTTLEIAAGSGTPPTDSVALSELLDSGFSTTLSVVIDGVTWTADAATELAGQPEERWLSGPLMTEWLVDSPLRDAAGNAHPHLQARFAVRAYRPTRFIRVSVVLENNWAYEPNPSNITYDLDVSVCGRSAYSRTAMVHYHHARWRKVFWCSTEPGVEIKHNVAYLLDSGAIANYDRTLVIPETTLVEMENNWANIDTEPMSIGLAQAYMRGAGGRPDIGPTPRWLVRWLLSQDKRARIPAFGTADLAGSWPIHYRDKNTDLPVSLADYPRMTLLGRRGDTFNPDTGEYEAFPDCGGDCTTPYTADDAHQPDFVYLPYIVTGDHYYLEELLFWANFNMFQSTPAYRGYEQGLFKWAQTRGQAWSMRTLGEAAYIVPDNHPMRAYFLSRLDFNLDWYINEYVAPTAPGHNPLGVITNGYALSYNSGRGIAPWQDDFFTWAIGHLQQLGFSKAGNLMVWKSGFPIGRMIDPGFCWIFGSEYSLNIRDADGAPFYADFASVYAGSVDPIYLSMECGSQEMADSLGLQLNEMVGYSSSTIGYPANMQPALAVSVDSGVTGALDAWLQFESRSVKPDYNPDPTWAIVPRTLP